MRNVHSTCKYSSAKLFKPIFLSTIHKEQTVNLTYPI